MRRIALLAVLVVSVAYAADDQAYFAIEAETSLTKMGGMAMPGLPPGFQLPPGVQLPPEVRAMMSGKASRKLNIRLWSPTIAPTTAEAYVNAPAGLKQGDRLNLELYRPKPEEGTTGTPGTTGPGTPPGRTDITIKMYWGSSKTVRPGQPKVIHIGDLTPEQRSQAEESQRRATAGSSYFYKPGWTTGYWPTKTQPGAIADDALLAGTFGLVTNYTGNVSLDVPDAINFLNGIELSSPDLSKKPDLNTFIDYKWADIPGLLGANAQMMGMMGRNTIIIWSSSEIEAMPWVGGFLQMAEVRHFVETKQFMPPEQTEAIVPEGIFKGTDMQMFTMTGWGKGTAKDNTQPLPRLQTKTELHVTFMGNRPGRGGQPPADDN